MSHAADIQTALMVVRVLREAGHQALFAGGCVRDMLLGIESTDYDVATDATPEQVCKLFRRVLLVGAAFGVAMVIVRKKKVEVTTFRSDVSYTDGRRPDAVRYSTPQEDALRRDFTINGMFYDPVAELVIDYVGGQEDLRAGVIRTIGLPDARFDEDYLRMLRAVRFATRFGFAIDQATADAVRRHAARITSISGERILDELTKMLLRDTAAKSLTMLRELGLAQHILLELFALAKQARPATTLTESFPWALYDESILRVQLLTHLPHRDQRLMLAALLTDLDKPAIGTITRRWGASNEVRQTAYFTAEHRDEWRDFGAEEDKPHHTGTKPLWRFKRLLANEDWPRLLAIWQAHEQMETSAQAFTQRIAARAAAIASDQITPPPFVTGEDLKSMGLTEGPKLGRLLEELYRAQQDERVTTREEAFELARTLIAG